MYTENISRSGLLIAWRGENAALPVPALGQIITVEVELPANHGFGQKCIHVQGNVIRVIDSGAKDCPRVALRVNYMDFSSVPRSPPHYLRDAPTGRELLDGLRILMEAKNSKFAVRSCYRP